MITERVNVLSFLILLLFLTIKGSHFNGGTINWAPVDPYTNSSPVVITITQTYSWLLSGVDCKPNVPISTSSRSDQNRNLTCISSCSNDGGYSTSPIDILTDCISSSSSMNMMKSQRSKNVTLNSDAYFTVAYKDGNWRSLENSDGNQWAIASFIDIRRRPDGIINTPPVATVQSPQYAVPNRLTYIKIPVSDINQGDNLRCRWALKSG